MTAPSGPTGLHWTTGEVEVAAYLTDTIDMLVPVARACDAELIGSRCQPEGPSQHVLLVDIDRPCLLVVDGDGHQWLHVTAELSDRKYRRLRRRLTASGLLRAEAADRPTTGFADAAARRAVDTLCSSAETWQLGYAQLFHTAVAVAGTAERGEPVELPDDGVWLPLADRHLLVDSRTEGHHHLLGTVPMPWSALRRVLSRLTRAGLVEADWVRLCKRRDQAVLHRPGRPRPPRCTRSYSHEYLVP